MIQGTQDVSSHVPLTLVPGVSIPIAQFDAGTMKRRTQSILVLTLLSMAATVSAEVPTRIVAVTGERAPGTFDSNQIARFNAFSDLADSLGPVINNRGQVAFIAQLTPQDAFIPGGVDIDQTNDRGIWSEGNGSLSLVAREANLVAGTATDVFGNFLSEPVLNDQGMVAFLGNFDGNAADMGIWSGEAGALNLLTRTGEVPVASGINVERFFSFGPPLLNNQNQVAFAGVLEGAGLVPEVNDRGIWAQVHDAVLDQFPRAGQIAPGVIDLGASTVHFTNFSTPRFNDASELAFRGELVGDDVSENNARGIWSQGGDSELRLVAREGNRAPGTNFAFAGMGIPAFNTLGHTAFNARLVGAGSGSGIWSENKDGLRLLAVSGKQAPGTELGVAFESFRSPVLNNNNRVAFEATLTGLDVVDGVNDEGIWVERRDRFHLVARSGQQAPGTAEGVRFDDLNVSLSQPTVNQHGQVAFISTLIGDDVTAENDLGIFAMTPRGELVKVAQTGDSVEIAPGVFRTISNLKLRTGSGGGDGLGRSFNDRSQLVYWAAFAPEADTTFGTEGVLVSRVTSSSTFLIGDANGDGWVNRLDAALLAEWFGSYEFWEGDFDLDVKITVNDLGMLQDNYGLGPGQSPQFMVPEPSAFVLTLFAAVAMVSMRRRRRRVIMSSRGSGG